MVKFLYHKTAIREAAEWLIDQIGSARVICFHGEMGAGKTTFIQAFCRQLGVEGTVSSPTFPIIHEYSSNTGEGCIYHMDLYRLEDAADAERAGVVDALDSGSICLVEWPGKLPELIPPDAFHLEIGVIDDQKRSLQLLNK